MSREVSRASTGPAPRQLLARMLENPDLVETVQTLEPRALGRLIEHIGLEDAGEIVALATVEQLQKVFDEELWGARPGETEEFDPERFALWLEVLSEAGPDAVAKKFVELPEELVTLALHRQLLVVDIDAMAVEMSEMGERRELDLIEKALDSVLYHEVEAYRVMARHQRGWDAMVALLATLGQDHHDFLMRALERCAEAARHDIEENGGLYSVLTSDEMLASDAAAEREDRRAAAGFVPPADAAAFLKRARSTALDTLVGATDRDAITRAYFRLHQPGGSGVVAASAPPPASLARLLEEAGVLPAPPRQLASGEPRRDLLAGAMAILAARDPVRAETRRAELAYLANVLVAGCSLREQRFRPFDAARAALAVCNLGLEHIVARGSGSGSGSGSEPAVDKVLAERGAEQIFSVGWHLLNARVKMPAAQMLGRKRKSLGDDAPAVQAVEPLRDECPHLVGDAGHPRFIANAADLAEAGALIAALGAAGKPGKGG